MTLIFTCLKKSVRDGHKRHKLQKTQKQIVTESVLEGVSIKMKPLTD